MAKRTVLIASTALLYLALFALAVAQPQHGDVLTGRRLAIARQQQARFFGWVLLAASLATVLVTAQPVYATLWWIGAWPAVGLPLVAARSYRPEFARAVAAAAVVAVPFGLILAAI